MEQYTLSFDIKTTADPSQLLDALIDVAASFGDDFESQYDIRVKVDEESPCVESQDERGE